jgi:hypothetical protein
MRRFHELKAPHFFAGRSVRQDSILGDGLV